MQYQDTQSEEKGDGLVYSVGWSYELMESIPGLCLRFSPLWIPTLSNGGPLIEWPSSWGMRVQVFDDARCVNSSVGQICSNLTPAITGGKHKNLHIIHTIIRHYFKKRLVGNLLFQQLLQNESVRKLPRHLLDKQEPLRWSLEVLDMSLNHSTPYMLL